MCSSALYIWNSGNKNVLNFCSSFYSFQVLRIRIWIQRIRYFLATRAGSQKNRIRILKEQTSTKIIRKLYQNFLRRFILLRDCILAIFHSYLIWSSSKNLASTLKLKGIKTTKKTGYGKKLSTTMHITYRGGFKGEFFTFLPYIGLRLLADSCLCPLPGKILYPPLFT